MNSLVPFLLVLSSAAFIAVGCVPNRFASRHLHGFRRSATFLAGLQALIAAGVGIAIGTGITLPQSSTLVRFSSELPLNVSVYFDSVAAIMFALVSFVGWVIFRYSMRYLDGESGEGRYYRWTSFTLGAVCMMVVSGNLLMFIAAWVMTSLGLHQLLIQYGDRPAACRAAWTKFTISRIGDAALVIAMVLFYRQYGTLDFADLFALSGKLPEATSTTVAAGFLLVVGAITKSAQFPFHTWLPLTMETPTPVSALMHAGIVNAGGYLIIRTSPLLTQTPAAMTMLALVGGGTACFAAIVMLTQTSIKKTLAYSTIAQMGFMLLQCGLGAYSAAMLHIVAHSLYKAHAFLSSGSVLSRRAAMRGVSSPIEAGNGFRFSGAPGTMYSRATATLRSDLGSTLAAAVASLALLGLAFTIFRLNPMAKPGGLLLGGLLCLALTDWLGAVLRRGDKELFLRSLAVGGALCLIYSASYLAVDAFVSPSLPAVTAPTGWFTVTTLIAAGFAGLFLLQLRVRSGGRSHWLDRWHIHASNGFYIESILRRVFGSIVCS